MALSAYDTELFVDYINLDDSNIPLTSFIQMGNPVYVEIFLDS